MKKFKKMMALVIAMAMVLAMAVPTMAATITLKTQTGHTYEVYQVYTGTVDGDTLTEVMYGQNHVSGKTGFVDADELAELDTLSKAVYANDQAKIAAYKKFVKFSNPIATVDQGIATADLPAGWYVIRDKDDTVPKGDDYKGDGVTLYMFQVLDDNINISAKSGTVESEKHVDDQNDSNANDHSELKDSADYDIGDLIPYTLTFKLPENYHDYLTYYVKFTDVMSAGLSYNGDAKIYYGENDTTGAAINFGTKDEAGATLEFEIDDLKATAPALGDEDVITIKYNAYLNEKAVIGSDGNPNTYTVEFNNNPNDSGKDKPTGTTPEDKNIVFTYKTIFDKVDENGKALPGADFILEKKVGNDWVDVTGLGGTNGKHPKKVGKSEDGDTTFSFEGLDAGDYRLTESFTPKGYNTISPIEFTITATHELVSDDPSLESLTGTGGQSITLTPSTSAGSLRASITNKSGAVLPSTGGIGTTIFYVVGAILAVGAGILLVTRRRMSVQ